MRSRHPNVLWAGRGGLGMAIVCLIVACGDGGTSSASVSTAPSTQSTSTTTSTAVASSSSSLTPSAGQADLSIGTAVARVGMTGDTSDPAGAHFVPAAVAVHVDDIVEWDYSPTAFIPHNIVFAEQPSLSNRLGLGAKATGQPGAGVWQVRFTRPGVYPYVCTFHPGMAGTVTVG